MRPIDAERVARRLRKARRDYDRLGRQQAREAERPAGFDLETQCVCPACGGRGPHFAPPSLGEPGFFICQTGGSE